MQIVYSGKIRDAFTGFGENRIFVMTNGSYWMQTNSCYWYHYAYRPTVTITRENGKHFLHVAGRDIPVRRVMCMVECQIDGAFTGWDGNSRYMLSNGQCWEQVQYKYQYQYAYCPHVVVCDVGGQYMMQVSGTSAFVRRV